MFNFESGKFNVEETFVLHTYKKVLLASATWGETPKILSGCVVWGGEGGGGEAPSGVLGLSPGCARHYKPRWRRSDLDEGDSKEVYTNHPQVCENLSLLAFDPNLRMQAFVAVTSDKLKTVFNK